MLNLSSDAPEDLVTVYRVSNKNFVVESIRADESLWDHLQSMQPQNALNYRSPALESFKKTLVPELAELLARLCGEMIVGIGPVDKNVRRFHGPQYLFICGEGTCGRATNWSDGSPPERMVELGRYLHQYARVESVMELEPYYEEKLRTTAMGLAKQLGIDP
jgi:hypothetical protein